MESADENKYQNPLSSAITTHNIYASHNVTKELLLLLLPSFETSVIARNLTTFEIRDYFLRFIRHF